MHRTIAREYAAEQPKGYYQKAGLLFHYATRRPQLKARFSNNHKTASVIGGSNGLINICLKEKNRRINRERQEKIIFGIRSNFVTQLGLNGDREKCKLSFWIQNGKMGSLTKRD
jgi:hypothetical protein